MTRFFLIRHGETEWNTQGRWQGQIDLPLNPRGREQADQIAQSLSATPIHAIYSSDLMRAIDTAKSLADVFGLSIHTDVRLREIHQGEWQGLSIEQIQEHYASAFQERLNDPLGVAPPGGETAHDVRNRVVQFMEQALEKHPEETVAIVSHGFTIAVIMAHYKKILFDKVWDLVPKNASIQALEIQH